MRPARRERPEKLGACRDPLWKKALEASLQCDMPREIVEAENDVTTHESILLRRVAHNFGVDGRG